MNKDNFIILDIETNAEEDTPFNCHFHVIQIGATKITNGQFSKYKTFNVYIQPKAIPEYPSGGPILTEFIKKLTKIEQKQIDEGLTFPEAWDEFLKFCNPYFEFFVSWGKYDWDILKKNVDYYGLKWPFSYHVNIKDYYRLYFNNEEVKVGYGVESACKFFNISFNKDGQHNGLEDAKMITAITHEMSVRSFHTFKKKGYDLVHVQNYWTFLPTPKKQEPQYLINPVLVKRYKELKAKLGEMEEVLFSSKVKT